MSDVLLVFFSMALGFICALSLAGGVVCRKIAPLRDQLAAVTAENKALRETKALSEGAELIAAERRRQIEVEGWTPEHDNQWRFLEITQAAYCYMVAARRVLTHGDPHDQWGESCWPWSPEWWKPSEDPIRNLQKAGALIAAEIDRLKRIDAAKGGGL